MNFRTLDLNLLRVFDVLMAERNVTRAAARLSMTQPAVSNALRRLRTATREDLFISGPTGVTPTPQSEALWPTVRSALGGLREALEPQSFDPRTAERSFTLAMADANAALTAPVLVDVLQRENSKIELRFVPLTTRDPRRFLDHGQADLAVGFFPEVGAALTAEGGSGPEQLDPLYRSEYVCVMRRDHPLAGASELSLDAYCEADHLRVSFTGRPRGRVDEALALLGRERHVMLTVNQFFTAGSVVHRSDLLTVLPRSFVPATAFAHELTIRRLPFSVPEIEIGLLWHRRHEHDVGHRWLRSVVTDASHAVAKQAGAVEGPVAAPPAMSAEAPQGTSYKSPA